MHLFIPFSFHFQMHRTLCIIVILVNIQSICISMAVYSKFAGYMSSLEHALVATLVMYLTTAIVFGIVVYFDLFCIFIANRIRCINLILMQLIFDEPLSEVFLFLNSNHRILSHEFSHQTQPHRQPTPELKTIKWMMPLKLLLRKAVEILTFGKENDIVTKTRMARDDSKLKMALNKIWPIKLHNKTDCINESLHMDQFVNTFGLADINVLARV